jgi:pimeloyl-ACP methyl ester carboxylesterase
MNHIRYVELHGERVAYREAGRGDAVVLIHGMAGSSETWEPIIPHLATRYRVVAPDLLGHGQSAKPCTDYSLGTFAAGLRDLFDELGISRATIVGHSLGGGVAMQFLYQHPEYCRRLVLISSGGLGPDVGWILRLMATPGAEFVLPLFAPKLAVGIGHRIRARLHDAGIGSPQTDQIWQGYSSLSETATRAAFLRTLRSVVHYRGKSVSALARLSLSIDVPTLLIWGDRDTIIPVVHGSAAQAGSRLQVLPGLGHFPHIESPAAVVAAIEDFISGNSESNDQATRANWQRELPPHTPEAINDQQANDVRTQTLIEKIESRRAIEVAIGVLMGLRGCSQTESINELTSAAEEMELSLAELCHALVELASGNATSPHRAAVQHRWRHLLASRGMGGGDGKTGDHAVRVRYGPENTSTIR